MKGMKRYLAILLMILLLCCITNACAADPNEELDSGWQTLKIQNIVHSSNGDMQIILYVPTADMLSSDHFSASINNNHLTLKNNLASYSSHLINGQPGWGTTWLIIVDESIVTDTNRAMIMEVLERFADGLETRTNDQALIIGTETYTDESPLVFTTSAIIKSVPDEKLLNMGVNQNKDDGRIHLIRTIRLAISKLKSYQSKNRTCLIILSNGINNPKNTTDQKAMEDAFVEIEESKSTIYTIAITDDKPEASMTSLFHDYSSKSVGGASINVGVLANSPRSAIDSIMNHERQFLVLTAQSPIVISDDILHVSLTYGRGVKLEADYKLSAYSSQNPDSQNSESSGISQDDGTSDEQGSDDGTSDEQGSNDGTGNEQGSNDGTSNEQGSDNGTSSEGNSSNSDMSNDRDASENSLTDREITETEGQSTPWPIASLPVSTPIQCAAMGALVCLAVLTVILITKRKKSRENSSEELGETTATHADDQNEDEESMVTSPDPPSVPQKIRVMLRLIDPATGRLTSQQYYADMQQDMLIVGRDPSKSQLVINNDRKISSCHFKLYYQRGIMYINDEGSLNKTYVNGQIVSSTIPLQQNSRLTVGNTILVITWSRVA